MRTRPLSFSFPYQDNVLFHDALLVRLKSNIVNLLFDMVSPSASPSKNITAQSMLCYRELLN